MISFFYGAVVSFINICLYYSLFSMQNKRVSRYQSQAVVAVAMCVLVRYVTIGALLALVIKNIDFKLTYLILGFVLGQLFFLIYQILVVKNNGK